MMWLPSHVLGAILEEAGGTALAMCACVCQDFGALVVEDEMWTQALEKEGIFVQDAVGARTMYYKYRRAKWKRPEFEAPGRTKGLKLVSDTR
jgi:hypothetical protein